MTEKICRLCLRKIIDENYQSMEESLLKTLKLNLNISKETVMCAECVNYIQVFSNFKTSSGYMSGKTLPVFNHENDIGLDPLELESTNNLTSVVVKEIKCSFCPKIGGRESFVLLNQTNGYESLVNMLKQHIMETNLNSTEGFLTCETCLVTLQDVLSFISKYLEIEDKISKYIEVEGIRDNMQIELRDVQKFTFKPTIKIEQESLDLNELGKISNQIKNEYVMKAETEMKYEIETNRPEVIKTEFLDIKSEQNDSNSCQDPLVENKIADDPLEISEIRNKKHKMFDS